MTVLSKIQHIVTVYYISKFAVSLESKIKSAAITVIVFSPTSDTESN